MYYGDIFYWVRFFVLFCFFNICAVEFLCILSISYLPWLETFSQLMACFVVLSSTSLVFNFAVVTFIFSFMESALGAVSKSS